MIHKAAVVGITLALSLAATAQAQTRTTAAPAGLLECPIQQTPVKNGARPNPELFRSILRCAKREKPVPAGQEGAVQVEVTALQIGAPRRWSYRQDSGSGQVGTMVYPVRASYTVRTFYFAATEVEEGWMRVLNFYVDAFGEWRIGSEEPVRPPMSRRIPR